MTDTILVAALIGIGLMMLARAALEQPARNLHRCPSCGAGMEPAEPCCVCCGVRLWHWSDGPSARSLREELDDLP